MGEWQPQSLTSHARPTPQNRLCGSIRVAQRPSQRSHRVVESPRLSIGGNQAMHQPLLSAPEPVDQSMKRPARSPTFAKGTVRRGKRHQSAQVRADHSHHERHMLVGAAIHSAIDHTAVCADMNRPSGTRRSSTVRGIWCSKWVEQRVAELPSPPASRQGIASNNGIVLSEDQATQSMQTVGLRHNSQRCRIRDSSSKKSLAHDWHRSGAQPGLMG